MFLRPLDGDFLHIMVYHDPHQFLEAGLGGIPAQLLLRLGRVAPQVDHIRQAVEVGADLDQDAAGGLVDALFLHALALPFQLDPGIVEGQGGKLPDAVLHPCRDHEIFRLVVLEDQPHTLHIVLGVTPVPQAGQVAEIELVLLALGDPGGSQGDLAGDKSLAPALGLVVEQDAGAAEHMVGLPVLLDDPEAVLLGHGIGRIGVERGGLPLGDFLHLAVQLGGGGLVDAAGLGQPTDPHRFQDAQHAGGHHVGGIFRHVKADLHMALGRQVVDLIRANLTDQLDQADGIAQVAIF